MDGGPTSSSEPDAKPLSVLTSQIQRQQQATGHDGPGVDRRGPSWQADDRFDAVKNPISPSATSTSIPIPRKTSASAAAANPRRIRRQTTEGALGDGFPGNFSSSPPDDFLIFSSSQPRQAGMSRSVHTSGRSRTVTAPLPIPMSYHAPSAATTSAHNFHADLLPAPSFTDGTFFTAGRSPGRGLGKSPGTSPMKSSVSPGRSLGKPSAGRSPEPALRTHPLPRKGDKEWEEEEKEKENLKKMEEKRTLGKKKESRESLLADLKTDFKSYSSMDELVAGELDILLKPEFDKTDPMTLLTEKPPLPASSSRPRRSSNASAVKVTTSPPTPSAPTSTDPSPNGSAHLLSPPNHSHSGGHTHHSMAVVRRPRPRPGGHVHHVHHHHHHHHHHGAPSSGGPASYSVSSADPALASPVSRPPAGKRNGTKSEGVVGSASDRERERKLRQGRLLLVSLLENFCMLYDQSPERNRRLFFVLCKQLSAMGIIDSEDFIDEVSAVRGSYKRAFRDLVVQAMQAIQDEQYQIEGYEDSDDIDGMLSAGPEGDDFKRNSLVLSRPASTTSMLYATERGLSPITPSSPHITSARLFPPHAAPRASNVSVPSPSTSAAPSSTAGVAPIRDISELLDLHTSRYREDFEELRALGRGAFGQVWCVRNRLDGCEYAVKRIRLVDGLDDACSDGGGGRRRKKDRFERILREVKVQARLSHPNVVRYFSCWLEHAGGSSVGLAMGGEEGSGSGSMSGSDEDTGTGTGTGFGGGLMDDLGFDEYKSEDELMSAREGFRRVGSGLRREMTPPTPSDISIEFLSDAAVGTSFVEKDDEEEEDDDDDENDEDDDEDSDADDEDNDADDSEGEGPLTIGSFKTNTTESVSLHTIRRARSTTDYETASASSASEAAPIRGALMTRLNGTRKSKSSRRSEDSKLQRDLTLFIQMELCGATLQEYLLARNRSLFSKTNFSATSLSHPAPDLEIFRDVCEGLAYLHSQNCIHRDIAPKNLFWVPDDDGSSFEITSQNGTSPGCGFWWWETDASSLRRRRGHWKIGDFGLVTTALASDPLGDAASTTTAAPSTLDQESLSFVEPPLAGSVTPPRKDSFQSDISSSPLAGTIMTAGVHLANLRSQRRSSSINSGDHSHFHHHHGIKPQTTLVDMEAAAVDTQNAASGSHNTTSNGRTTGVGTVTYASPEQLNPNPSVPYTSSSDLYSLGIVLFELLHPFSTGMERAERLTALRGSGAMPDAFVRAWPKEATLVLWLMSEDPTKRPTAREVLELEWWDTETGADTAEAGAEALKRRASWSMPEVGGTPSKATLEGRIMRSRSSGLPNAAGVGLQVRTSSATIATQTDAPPGSAGGRIVSGGISLRVPGILSPVASATPGRSRAASVTVGTGMEEDAEANARSGAASAAGSSANTSPSMPRDHHHHHHVDGKKPGVVKRIAAVFAHVADSIVHPSHREDKEKSGGVDEDAVTAGPKESGGGRGEDAKKAWEEVDALTRRVRELEEKVKSLGGVVD